MNRKTVSRTENKIGGRTSMRKLAQGAILTCIAASGWMSASADVVIYGGLPAAETQTELRPWGSGKIEEIQEIIFTGSRSLRITTRGAFAGGWLNLSRGADVRSDMNNAAMMLRFTLRLPGITAAGGGGGGGGLTGGGDLGSPGGLTPPGGQGGRPGGFGTPGGLGGGGGSGSGTQNLPPLTSLRIILETTDGKRTEFTLPLEAARTSGDTAWVQAGIPLQAIPGLRETNGQISKVGMFGNTTSLFVVGEIRTTVDQFALNGYMIVTNTTGLMYDSRSNDKIIIAANDELIFYGQGEAGSTHLVYRWNFGDGTSNEVDAEAPAIRRRFPKSGNYVVQLTIADPHGIKPPKKASIKVQVN
jgi:hypothetical protein